MLLSMLLSRCTKQNIYILKTYDKKICASENTKRNMEIMSYLCRLLITFVNSLDPDQARQNAEPDLDPKYLRLMVFILAVFH